MSITPADLAVGQVWLWRKRDRTIVRIQNGWVTYEFIDAEGVHRTEMLSSFVFAHYCQCEGTLVPTPSPVPHPDALADLYAACKAAQDVCYDAAQGAYDREEAAAALDAIRAALAKAGGK